MNESSEDSTPRDAATAEQPVPRYEKPVIRRYDQIDQVRPYGPSEV